jgi:hypothetical protein
MCHEHVCITCHPNAATQLRMCASHCMGCVRRCGNLGGLSACRTHMHTHMAGAVRTLPALALCGLTLMQCCACAAHASREWGSRRLSLETRIVGSASQTVMRKWHFYRLLTSTRSTNNALLLQPWPQVGLFVFLFLLL